MQANIENNGHKSEASVDNETDKPNIDRLLDLVKDDVLAVNHYIMEKMQSPVALIPQLAGHIIAAGGKRLRPLLTLACARMCGYEGPRHIAMAATVEFIHTATLLHDDVVDESALRRGQDSANAIWGNQASVLVGDFLFSRAFQLAVADGTLPVLKILSDASAILAEGEVLQLMTTNDLDTSETSYLQVIESKTAVLFAAACELGPVIAERPEDEAVALRKYGQFLGVAFQLVDDYLDYSAKQADLGKTVGDDLREGKVTLPVILAYAAAQTDDEKAFWVRVIEDLDQKDGDFEEATRQMIATDALRNTVARAEHYGSKAKESLDIFPDSPEKAALLELVDFCVHRAH